MKDIISEHARGWQTKEWWLTPFLVTYMRHGAHQYNGLSKRDWWIFITSTVIGNVYWTLAVYMGITLVEKLWQLAV